MSVYKGMPIPKPKQGERREDFLSRCLSSDIMQQEYSDNSQRMAVCSTAYDNKDKKMFDDEIQEISGLDDSTLFENASSPSGKTEQAYRNNSFTLDSSFGKSIN